jgi:lipoprotein-anchoring transpeptidase ErfK/SrfK
MMKKFLMGWMVLAAGSLSARAEETNARVLLAQGETAMTQGLYLDAKRCYQQALQMNPDAQTAAAAQERLGQANVKLILSPLLTADAIQYEVQPGDTLARIAKKHTTTVELLRASNPVRGDFIRVGEKLKVNQARFNVLVDKSQNLLTLKSGEEVVKVYRCSTGARGITPAGAYKIVNRMVDPVWKGIVAPGDPENPLGTRWLGFDLPQYGIHGTHQPETIGQPVTKGCVRLVNSDAEELYTLLPEGTLVTIVE